MITNKEKICLTVIEEDYIFGKVENGTLLLPFKTKNNPEYLRDLNKAISESEFPKVERSRWVYFLDDWPLSTRGGVGRNIGKIVGAQCLGFFFHQ